jgi:hypothetical protein
VLLVLVLLDKTLSCLMLGIAVSRSVVSRCCSILQAFLCDTACISRRHQGVYVLMFCVCSIKNSTMQQVAAAGSSSETHKSLIIRMLCCVCWRRGVWRSQRFCVQQVCCWGCKGMWCIQGVLSLQRQCRRLRLQVFHKIRP